MGAWGIEPWDSDGAADWFADTWEMFPIGERINDALQGSDSEEMVAALWLASELCRTYVWPPDDLDNMLTNGIAAADRLLDGDDPDEMQENFLDEEDRLAFIQKIASFRDALISRR